MRRDDGALHRDGLLSVSSRKLLHSHQDPARTATGVGGLLLWAPTVPDPGCSRSSSEQAGRRRVSSWRTPAGGWGQDGSLGTVKVGGPRAPGGRSCQGLRLLHTRPSSARLSRLLWGPWLGQELPLVPDPRSLRPVHVLSVVGLAHWRIVLMSTSAYPVLSAGASRELPLTGGPWADSGGWRQLGKVLSPRVCARHHGTRAGRGLSPASACLPEGSAQCSAASLCGGRRREAREASGSDVSELLGRQRARGWTPEMRATPQTVLRGHRRWEPPGSD